MTVIANNNVNAALATVANDMTSNALALRVAGESAAKAQMTFAQSTVAAVLTGVSSLAFAEASLLGVFGSPKDAKGKAIKSASGLRDIEGGFSAYQAFRVIRFVVENMDADAPVDVTHPTEGTVTNVGTGEIRTFLTAFALGESDVRGVNGAKKRVETLIAAHAAAVAAAMGVKADGEGEGEGEGKDADKGGKDAPVSLIDTVTATLLRLQSADDAAFTEAQTALAALSDYIDSRWNAIADAEAAAAPVAVNG